jgi:hypothetical protein
MRTYSLHIHDDRYAVPTLDLATAGDEAGVREIAGERLEASPNHLAVEVRAGDAMLFSLSRDESSPDDDV